MVKKMKMKIKTTSAAFTEKKLDFLLTPLINQPVPPIKTTTHGKQWLNHSWSVFEYELQYLQITGYDFDVIFTHLPSFIILDRINLYYCKHCRDKTINKVSSFKTWKGLSLHIKKVHEKVLDLKSNLKPKLAKKEKEERQKLNFEKLRM